MHSPDLKTMGLEIDLTRENLNTSLMSETPLKPAQLPLKSIQNIVDLTPSLIYSIEGAKVSFLNLKAFEQFGYSPQDLQNWGESFYRELVHPDDLKAIQAFLDTPLENRSQSPQLFEYRIRSKAGDWMWVQDRFSHFLTEDGRSITIGFATNIDSFKKNQIHLEQVLFQIQQTQAQLAHSAKMAALGEMSSGIAHEINNPLTVIQARAFQIQQLAELKQLDPNKMIQISDSISKTADKIARIIKSLRSFSRDGSADPIDLVPVRMLIEETLELCHVRLKGQGVQIDYSEVPENLDIECRIIQLEQVLLNLINNAHDAIMLLPEKWIRIGAFESADSIEIWVMDSGPGIPTEILPRIMMPFFTTKEVNKGTGLGLSISQGLIKGHGGELFVDQNSPNTKFVIRLPRGHIAKHF